jgi:hypothetical protein|mmetsp:Transcript_32226/g.5821  ORF Transcript_32226/g.5821 Transcript_32226/m.5821 type:complete len:110 (-) Transcript_32226:86-415(-)
MLHRLFNIKGVWYRPSHLASNKLSNLPFELSWRNLNLSMSLKEYNRSLHEEHSRYYLMREIEMEALHDDIFYHHYRQSWYHFIAWAIFTMFLIDVEGLDRPGRHWMTDS